MAGNLEPLNDELERSYHEAQERMSDPAVYNDHREAAGAGRKLKELEGPYKLAQRWREARADLDDALDDSDPPGCRRGRGRTVGGRSPPRPDALRGTARLHRRASRSEPERSRWLQGDHVRDQRRRRVL